MSKVRRATVDDIRDYWDEACGAEGLDISERLRRELEQSYMQGEAYSIFTDEDQIIAVVGGAEMHPGFADVWALVFHAARHHAMTLHRATVRVFHHLREMYGLRRMEINVLASEPRFVRWAQRLGFSLCGTREQWGPNGEDFLLFAWTRAR